MKEKTYKTTSSVILIVAITLSMLPLVVEQTLASNVPSQLSILTQDETGKPIADARVYVIENLKVNPIEKC